MCDINKNKNAVRNLSNKTIQATILKHRKNKILCN